MNYQFKVLSEQEVYRGFFKLRRYEVDFELFRGGMSGAVIRECSTTSGFVVCALPYDPETQEFLLIEQFRIGAMVAGCHPWQLEAVAGFMDKPGETPAECLQRELQEEVGLQGEELEYVDTYFGGAGGSAGQTHFYFVRVQAAKAATYTGLLDEGEDILVHRVPFAQAFRWLFAGEIQNATLILALQAFLLRKTLRPHLGQWINGENRL